MEGKKSTSITGTGDGKSSLTGDVVVSLKVKDNSTTVSLNGKEIYTRTELTIGPGTGQSIVNYHSDPKSGPTFSIDHFYAPITSTVSGKTICRDDNGHTPRSYLQRDRLSVTMDRHG